MDEQGFKRMVEVVQTNRGLSLVAAIYHVNDKLTREADRERATPWACRKGCSYCCYQLVLATEAEWKEIERFFLSIRDPKVRIQLKQRLKPRMHEWSKWVRCQVRFQIGHPASTELAYRAWLGKPCVFLGDEGECLIYPVRPIDCRTAFSTEQCGSGQGGGMRFPYDWNGWANNLILEEAKRLAGQRPIVLAPLPYWLEWLDLLH